MPLQYVKGFKLELTLIVPVAWPAPRLVHKEIKQGLQGGQVQDSD
jgi:hypothetical protein